MELNSNEKRILSNLFQSPAWTVINKVLKGYKEVHFYETSAKRGTEFDTMWNIAHTEGGKEHLEGFMSSLEDVTNE